MSTVTVCIPTYNRAELLREAIQSVLAQTYLDWELLVSDNASTDHTAEVVAAFKDARIHYYRQPENIGMMPNFRSAIEKVSTEWVALLPDDDQFLPEHLEVALAALSAYPQAAYYACPATYFGELDTGALRPHAVTDLTTPLLYFAPTRAVEFLGLDNPGPLHIVARRRAFHPQIFWGKGDFPPFDMLILTQLMVQGGFVFGNRSTTRFRMHRQSTSVGANSRRRFIRYNCMVWFCIRWLAQFLLAQGLSTVQAIEDHGMHAASDQHVVPLVLALASWDSPPPLRTVARRVFRARSDMDRFSARFRLARRVGFWVLPWLEKMDQAWVGWHP